MVTVHWGRGRGVSAIAKGNENRWTKRQGRHSRVFFTPAADGLKHIFSKTADCDPLELAQSLEENQKAFYDALGLEFPTWNGNEIGLKEIEHSLCEYSKYQRFRQGGRGKCARRPSVEKSNESMLFSCNACMGYQSEAKSESQSTNPFWLCKPCRAFASVSFAE